MGGLVFHLLLVGLLAEFSICVEVDLSGKPTRPPDVEEVNPFDIISKQTRDMVLPAGRSGKSGLYGSSVLAWEVSLGFGASLAGSNTLIQGDIVWDENEMDFFKQGRSASQNIVVLLWPRKLWRTRTVPYIISGHSYSSIKKIEAALRDLETKVCLKFRQRTSGDKAWLRIHRGSSCWANIGRSLGFGKTDVSLGRGCLSETLIQHEIIHALGFFHEQSRRDRDNYVTVLSQNISPSNLYNFDKTKKYAADTFGLPYDHQSIMHYTRTTWTKNGQDTMKARGDPNLLLGGLKLSANDIKKVNRMYHCHVKAGTRWTEWSDWSSCIRNYYGCYRSKHRICLVENLALCPGADEFGVQSTPQKCPSESYCNRETVDGFWGSWSSWSSCSKSCDKGTRSRSRKCDSPRAAYGGRECTGAKTDTEGCIRRTCKPNKYYTNFDNGFGVWSNVQGHKDPLNWQRGRGRTSYKSGPVGDHTDGKGWYLYVSTASYETHRKKATLVSEYLSGFKCISLAFCMNGKNMGRLDFSVQTSQGKWSNFAFKKKGHQGTGWHHAEFSMEGPDYKKFSYRFFIEATTGIAPYSDIAIDDILIENGPCGSNIKEPVQKKPNPAIGGVVSQGCKNKNKECVTWSKTGECHRNPIYMLKDCCLACRAMGDCNKDLYGTSSCSEWAGKGECMKNKIWMWKNCCKSCKKQGKCEDKQDNCNIWGKDGWCDKKSHAVWMWKNCCASCSDAWESSKSCSDSDDRCSRWVASGECKKNPSWMLENCCKSCKSQKK